MATSDLFVVEREQYPWLEENEISADPSGDLNTPSHPPVEKHFVQNII
jgi:hypothetical protein